MTMQAYEIKRQLVKGRMTSELLSLIIASHASEATALHELYEAYCGDVAIQYREFDDNTLINEKISNDFRGEIIDQISGYVLGKPIVYKYEEEDKAVTDHITTFRKLNALNELNLTTIKMASCCGRTYRLLYTDENGDVCIMHCDPWEIIPIWDVSGTYIEMALRYYQGYDASFLPVTRAEVYYERDIDIFQTTSAAALALVETKSHNFAEMPVVEFMANDECLGDFEKVASLIDAYDLSMSDAQNEIEEFRQAYQVYENCSIDADGKAAAREMGAINIPKGGKVTYLVKDLNPEYLKEHLDRLRTNIYRFAKTVDMSDEKFSGNAQSGESRKWKLLSLEFRATIRELKMTAGFMDEFRIAQFIWNAKGIAFDYLKLSFQFTRNLPMEMTESATNAAKLKGIVSDKTLLGTLPFVEDVVQEMADLEEQAENAIDLSVEPYVNTEQV